MDVILLLIWLFITLLVTAGILHEIGKEYGAHVAMSWATRVGVFMAAGTAVGAGIGFARWWVL